MSLIFKPKIKNVVELKSELSTEDHKILYLSHVTYVKATGKSKVKNTITFILDKNISKFK